MKQILCLSVAVFALSACGKKDVETLPADTVGLRITSEVAAGVKAGRISVIPNDVAPWLSQILLLADGQLYRTFANGGKVQAVNGGTLKDMIGLSRIGAAGTALTLTKEGELSALIEKDDEGRLARMNTSAKASSYDGFCQTVGAPSDTVWAFEGKSIITLNISYQGDNVMTIEETDRSSIPKSITSCFVSGETKFALADGKLFSDRKEAGKLPGKITELAGIYSQQAPTLLYVGDDSTLYTLRGAKTDMKKKVVIQDGLSVMGTENISTILSTSDNIGGTFSGGALIAQDANSDRIVIIALPIAERALSKQQSENR